MRINYSFASAEKLAVFPQRIRFPYAVAKIQPKVPRFKLECKGCALRSTIHVLRSSPAFSIRPHFRTELTNSLVPYIVPSHGLRSGIYTGYYGSISRSFSQVPRVGTRTDIIKKEDGDGDSVKTSLLKTLSRNLKRPKAVSAEKGNVTSVEELGINTSKSKAPVASKKVENVETDAKLTPKTKDKAKQKSQSKSKKKNPSSAIAISDAVDPPINTEKVSQAKKSRSKTSKESPISLENNTTSSTLVKLFDGDISKKDVPKKAKKTSTKKEKSVAKVPAPLKSNKKVTVQLDKVSPIKINPLGSQGGRKTWPQLYPPISKSVLVVESATKAKVIQGYLGEMFEVLPSYGHVRDLAARSGSVRPDDDFSMVWEVPSAAWSHLKSIKVALSGADNLILASDPDREGEAIAWHIIEMLQQQGALREEVTVARVVFNEITESSIKTALQAPREIDGNLVQAYLARRALDYLIGFNVSPLLWRKLPGCQSAGRVQSAALALISDREQEIELFKSQEYWTIRVGFHLKDQNPNSISLPSHLTHFDSQKLNQFSVSSEVEAKDIEEKIINVSSKFEVIDSKTSKIRRNPPSPYITSTLQQDAANKFNFTASSTMKIAQKLYEGVQLSDGKATGLITYMRTDGLHLSDDAAKDIQSFVIEKYGHDFASKVTRKYFKKVKNAQEAHEAIRPTDIRRLPSNLVDVLDEDSMKLYGLAQWHVEWNLPS